MSKRTEYKALLRAMFTDDDATARAKAEELGDVPYRDAGLLVAAAFAIAMERRFADETSHEAVKSFVAEAQQNFDQAAGSVKPLMAEALVRAALGEPELMEEIPREDAVQPQILLTYKVLVEEEATPADVDRLLDEAEELAERWAPTR